MNSVYASGASAIAVPGWPALARWTASIASTLIVSMDSLVISRCSAALSGGALAWLETAIASGCYRPGRYSPPIMAEQFCDVGRGVTLCFETFGEQSDPTALLIMGLGTQ